MGESGDAGESVKVVGAAGWMYVYHLTIIIGIVVVAAGISLLTMVMKQSSCSLSKPRTISFDWSMEASEERALAECLPLTTDGKSELERLIAGVAAVTKLMKLTGTEMSFFDRN
ncbi:hypothetical protein EVAR_62886_1 [Eumeta japonica]|uniref:Uncharacterized protein n=1 Tax=Eumeta variegata TaxID=151549 RepID=A0A4C1ZTZ2_EUMVA|nr:hypothetical protein EVAR_62886_1 [Eumeta japonica]